MTTATEALGQGPGAAGDGAAVHSERLVKAKSDQDLPIASGALGHEPMLNRLKSRSLEPLAGLAMWSTEPVVIELQKGDRGLGFSILDYQVHTQILASQDESSDAAIGGLTTGGFCLLNVLVSLLPVHVAVLI